MSSWRLLGGVATVVVLVLRYVESLQDIVEDVEGLLSGKFAIVKGGLLTADEAPVVDRANPQGQTTLLVTCYSAVLRKGVIEADAYSPMRNRCMTCMSQLTKLVGSARSIQSSFKYVRVEHERLLTLLFRDSTSADDTAAPPCFDTLSAGAAIDWLSRGREWSQCHCLVRERRRRCPADGYTVAKQPAGHCTAVADTNADHNAQQYRAVRRTRLSQAGRRQRS